MSIVRIPPVQVKSFWGILKKGFTDHLIVLDEKVNLQDVLQKLIGDELQLWTICDQEEEPIALMITGIAYTFDNISAVHIYFMYSLIQETHLGLNGISDTVVKSIIDGLSYFGRLHGCNSITALTDSQSMVDKLTRLYQIQTNFHVSLNLHVSKCNME